MADQKISQLTSHITPIDADSIPILDSATSTTKRVTWSNIKATLKTYFDTLYTAVANNTGYTVQFSSEITAPADGTTYYIGSSFFPLAATTGGISAIRIPKAGTVKSVYVEVKNRGTLGTTETSTISLRKNNTSDTTISASFITSTTPNAFSVTGLSVAVVAGDYLEIKWVTPTWVTNPTTVDIWGIIYIE